MSPFSPVLHHNVLLDGATSQASLLALGGAPLASKDQDLAVIPYRAGQEQAGRSLASRLSLAASITATSDEIQLQRLQQIGLTVSDILSSLAELRQLATYLKDAADRRLRDRGDDLVDSGIAGLCKDVLEETIDPQALGLAQARYQQPSATRAPAPAPILLKPLEAQPQALAA